MAGGDFNGRVVLVTGGTRGLGLAICKRFAEAGATVIACGRSAVETPSGVEFMACDVRDFDSVKKMTDEIAARYGRIDVVVNNAGGSPPVDAATASPRFTERVIALNLLAPLYVAQAAYPHMPEGASVINIASVSGVRPSPGTVAYSAGKAGLIGATRSLAHEWGPKIRVNAIVVGYLVTETTEATYGDEAAQDAIAHNIAARRLGQASEVAEAVLFLASPAASYVTGAALEVHGGGERPPFLDIVKEHAKAE
jgi:NAD(P)-dependent dehydrogenase (short-subunit alcohol dehydrogenase family)